MAHKTLPLYLLVPVAVLKPSILGLWATCTTTVLFSQLTKKANDLKNDFQFFLFPEKLPYFIKYNVHYKYSAHLNFTMIFGKKFIFIFQE